MEKKFSDGSIQSQYNLETEEGQLTLLRHIVRMIDNLDEQIPPYEADTRQRDKRLLDFVRSETLLSGVVSSVVSQDKSRPWKLVGPPRQVGIYSQKLHDVNNGDGWRSFISKLSHSWYATNFGFGAEIGFRFEGGPAETLYSFDPTRVRHTGKRDFPVIYYPKDSAFAMPNNAGILLRNDELLKGNSLPSLEEDMNNAGFCALERALSFTRVLIGLNKYLLEKLGVAPPKGILHGAGFLRQEWDNAVQQAEEAAQNANAQVYKDLLVLLTANEKADLSLIGLSSLPDQFDITQFIEVFMNAYALAFNVSLYSIWMPASNNLGRGSEAKSSLEAAKIRGELDFSLTLQEEIQTKFMPSSVSFTFDSRLDTEESEKVKRKAQYMEMVIKAVEAVGEDGKFLLSIDRGQKLLAEQGIIPKSWTEDIEELETTDLQESRANARHSVAVQRAAFYNPDEPIVEYTYNPRITNDMLGTSNAEVLRGYHFPQGKVRVLFDKGSDLFQRS